MARKDMHRRDVLRWTAGVSASALVGSSAMAGETTDLLGELAKKILPGKTFSKVRAVAQIMALEKKTKSLALPYSPLEAIQPPPLVPTDDEFYAGAVTRLVAIIDKAEKADPVTADEAGELLAEVHAQERTIPDALKPVPQRLSTAKNFAALKAEYRTLFESMTVRDEDADDVNFHTKTAIQFRARYEEVSKETGVPWYFLAAIHGLEASCNFRAHLHNGDFPLNARTRQVPAGRPLVWLPPSDWASSALDALRLMGFTGQTDWSLERTLYRLEAYNGFGYRSRRVPTPYLWCHSNHYDKGKFVADGKWSPTAKSRQCGSAVLIKALANGGEISFS